MSYRNNMMNSEDRLVLEYINIIREQTSYQNRLILRYFDNIAQSSNNLRIILQQYLEVVERRVQTNRSQQNSSNIFQFTPQRQNLFTTDGWTNTNTNTNTNTYNTNRSTRHSPISSRFNLRRRTNRQPPANVSFAPPSRYNRSTRRRNQNILNQILEQSLYTSPNRQPASNSDISRNITNHIWREISNTTTQTLCPITQEEFQENDRISRIEHCGHIFYEDALNTYLTQFDHRCPMCRYNISSQIYPPRSYAAAASTTPSNIIRQNAFDLPSFDISYNFQNFPSLDISSNLTPNIGDIMNIPITSIDISSNNSLVFDFNNLDINDAVNQLSNAMLSSISTAISNPDNSGNTISAEYSVYLPQSINTQNNSTNTEDNATSADNDDETY